MLLTKQHVLFQGLQSPSSARSGKIRQFFATNTSSSSHCPHLFCNSGKNVSERRQPSHDGVLSLLWYTLHDSEKGVTMYTTATSGNGVGTGTAHTATAVSSILSAPIPEPIVSTGGEAGMILGVIYALLTGPRIRRKTGRSISDSGLHGTRTDINRLRAP